jgi:hypothetical protein
MSKQYIIESKLGIARNGSNQVLKYTLEEAQEEIKGYHWTNKAKVIEYNPAIHKDLKPNPNLNIWD